MVTETEVLIVGQGLAGSCLAWRLAELDVSFVILDDGFEWSSSLVAAGLVTPVTGKRLTAIDQYAALWRTAIEFYRGIEATTETQCFRTGRAVRFFQNEFEEQEYNARVDSYGPQIQTRRIAPDAFEMWPAGRLITPAFLEATREHFKSVRQYRRVKLNLPEDLELTDTSVLIESLDLQASVVVFCQGAQGRLQNPWFPEIPDTPVRGEVLEVKIDGFSEDRVLHKGVWLAPAPERGPSHFLLGSTYDRDTPVPQITEDGRCFLLSELRKFVDHPVEVIAHRAAVRPSTKARKTISAFHHHEHRLAVFNGLGSKGTLLGPTAARDLAYEIKRRLNGENSASARLPVRITEYVKERVASILRPGDFAIDATCGNGHDTVFLGKLVGETGSVLAFDIQKAAIERTNQRLREHNLKNVELISDSHERLEVYLKGRSPVLVMFNLGYLPGSDKSVVTKAESTTEAIEAVLRVLPSKGAVAVTAYRGHEHGNEEFERVYRLCEKYRREGFAVEIRESDSTVRTSPVFFFMQRL